VIELVFTGILVAVAAAIGLTAALVMSKLYKGQA
jgi:hypothetical protein